MLLREKRQAKGKPSRRQSVNTVANCNFKKNDLVDTCLWDNLSNYSSLQWLASKGEDAYWIGGPREDHTEGNLVGGYAFLETSALPDDVEKTNKILITILGNYITYIICIHPELFVFSANKEVWG